MRKLLVGLLLLAAGAVGETKPAVEIDIMPRIGQAPLTVRVRARVERADVNRELHLVMEGAHDGRTTSRELHGVNSAVFHEFQFDVRGGGCVTFSAVVVKADGSITRADVNGIYSSRLEEAPECGS